MLKETIIYFFLGVFLFQALVFNLFLYGFTLLSKHEDKTGTALWMEFTQQQYGKLKLNESEFTYHNTLYDILISKEENGNIKLLCKIDAKEKDLLEKLIEGFKQSKTKKLISFSFLGEMNTPCEFIIHHSCFIIHNSYFISTILKSSIERTIPPPKV